MVRVGSKTISLTTSADFHLLNNKFDRANEMLGARVEVKRPWKIDIDKPNEM